MKKALNFSFFLFAFTLFLSCSNAPEGEKVAAGEAQETVEADAKSETAYTVNTEKSVINWTGTKPGGAHTGTVNLSSGSLGVAGGNITSGSFVIDMTSIKNTDLDAETAPKLEGHLKTGDFFEVDAHPTGKFEITSVAAGSDVEGATHSVTGNLTLKGIAKSVTIPANIAMADGSVTVVTPAFTIDRTQWGINFKSGSIDATLKDNAINDEIGLNLQIVATANQVQ